MVYAQIIKFDAQVRLHHPNRGAWGNTALDNDNFSALRKRKYRCFEGYLGATSTITSFRRRNGTENGGL